MSVSDAFFQFPIGALRLGKPIEEVTEAEATARLYEIINYCLISYAERNFDEDDMAYEIAEEYKDDDLSRTGDLDDPSIAEVYYAARKLRVGLSGSLENSAQREWTDYNKIRELNVVGGNQLVRLRYDLFWDMQAMGWRDWSVLCAVAAAIGRNVFQKVSFERLNALALGYTTKKHLGQAQFEEWKLTDRKMGTTVKRLAGRSLFSKASPNGRHNYYSWKPLKELAEMLMQNELRKQEKKRITDSAVTQMIRDRVELELRRSRGSNPPKESGDESERHAKSREILLRGLSNVGKVSE